MVGWERRFRRASRHTELRESLDRRISTKTIGMGRAPTDPRRAALLKHGKHVSQAAWPGVGSKSRGFCLGTEDGHGECAAPPALPCTTGSPRWRIRRAERARTRRARYVFFYFFCPCDRAGSKDEIRRHGSTFTVPLCVVLGQGFARCTARYPREPRMRRSVLTRRWLVPSGEAI